MVMIDSSAWIEYFRNGKLRVVESVETCLQQNLVCMGDLIYFEIMQGIRSKQEKHQISTLFQTLSRQDMVGFSIAEKAAQNNALLRSKGITIRKSIDILIGTFCIENRFRLIHNDRDFEAMVDVLGLQIYK